jgi:aminoglycoside 6'-N-acetyltransferase I
MSVEIRILSRGDESILRNVAPGVFDNRVDERLSVEFLSDPRHHLVVAIEADLVVGFASAVHYIHPDKTPELWINEIAVAPSHQRRGLGKRLLQEVLAIGKPLGCKEAWVLTERSNTPAKRLYASMGGDEVFKEQVMYTFRLDHRSNS